MYENFASKNNTEQVDGQGALHEAEAYPSCKAHVESRQDNMFSPSLHLCPASSASQAPKVEYLRNLDTKLLWLKPQQCSIQESGPGTWGTLGTLDLDLGTWEQRTHAGSWGPARNKSPGERDLNQAP